MGLAGKLGFCQNAGSSFEILLDFRTFPKSFLGVHGLLVLDPGFLQTLESSILFNLDLNGIKKSVGLSLH